MDDLDRIYAPIESFQTRIISLHGCKGIPNAPLMCTLHAADILHETFEGLAIHPPTGVQRIDFVALSYTWGNSETPAVIICNEELIPIGANLYNALLALRDAGSIDRYLWIDAICINQRDVDEVAKQVSIMLIIYQKATSVIAWIGSGSGAQADVGKLLATEQFWKSQWSNDDFLEEVDIWELYRGLSYIYNRPWFHRIWVQQEVFAARELSLQCGPYRFAWGYWLADPTTLLDLVKSRIKSGKPVRGLELNANQSTQRQKGLKEFEIGVAKLNMQRRSHLTCFEQFSACEDSPDIVDTLLHTGKLGATNPKDYIYGVLGISGFPAQAISIGDWLVARANRISIPIDYAADVASVFATVTWALTVNYGLIVLAKLKACRAQSGPESALDFPSWVIDWRLAARIFDNRKWGLVARPHQMSGAPRDTEVRQLYNDNNHKGVPCTQLIVRGVVTSRYYINETGIWQKRSLRKPTLIWELGNIVKPDDLIVQLSGFSVDIGFEWSGLWLLRAVHNEPDHFTMVAFLKFKYEDFIDSWFEHQHWYHAVQSDKVRCLSVLPRKEQLNIESNFDGDSLRVWRKFTIV